MVGTCTVRYVLRVQYVTYLQHAPQHVARPVQRCLVRRVHVLPRQVKKERLATLGVVRLQRRVGEVTVQLGRVLGVVEQRAVAFPALVCVVVLRAAKEARELVEA